jgi:hypothetical protein
MLYLKALYKYIHNCPDVGSIWKWNFIVKMIRNDKMIEVPKTRISLCAKNYFIFSKKIFNASSKEIKD